MVRVPDLKSVDPKFKSHSDFQLDLIQVFPGSTPRCTCTQSTGLPPASWHSEPVQFVSLALKSRRGERSIKYTLYDILRDTRQNLDFTPTWFDSSSFNPIQMWICF